MYVSLGLIDRVEMHLNNNSYYLIKMDDIN